MTDQSLPLTPAEVPDEIDRWNWGAFLLNWIWGIGNNTPVERVHLDGAFPQPTAIEMRLAARSSAVTSAGASARVRTGPAEGSQKIRVLTERSP